MSKQYGLIHPKKDAQKQLVKLSAFDSDSDPDTKESTTTKKPNVDIGLIQKKQIARAQNAALTEDPTIFQYDELYDAIKNERERKKEYERRIERQVQKERETEGEMYKDKEAFITSSYKQKLEEMKKAEEEEKRFDYLESIGDVTKQRDLGGFYRHLNEQKMGVRAPVDTTKTDAETHTIPEKDGNDDESIKIKKSKEQVKKDRVYRKRKSSVQEASEGEEEETTGSDLKISAKKAHLQSNLDADSDFSIDSNTDEEEKGDNEPGNTQHNPTDVPTKDESQATSSATDARVVENEVEEVVIEEEKEVGPKIDRKRIWEKRTIGDALVGAIQRYFERKLLRED